MRRALIVVAILAPGAAVADDKSDELTVLPWTDATLVFSDADDRGAVSYAQTSENGTSLQLEASAPLDGDTRTASLTDANKLAGGFAAAVAVGWDSRANYLRELADQTAKATKALAVLATVPDWASDGSQAAYAAGLEPGPAPGSTDAIVRRLCAQSGAGDCSVPAVLPTFCGKYFGAPCANLVEFYAKGTEYWTMQCIGVRPVTDACAAAGFGTAYLQRIERYGVVQRFLGDKALVDEIVGVYEKIDPDGAKTLAACRSTGANREQCVADHLGDITTALRDFIRTEPLQRRDFMLAAVRDRKQWDLAIALRGSLSYDRSTVYQEDIATAPVSAVAYDLAIGPDLTAYAPIVGLSFNARFGVSRSRQTGASTFERCTTVNSSNPETTGTRCASKALFRKGDAPAPESSGFVRVAADYQYRGKVSKDDLIPGVELRAGLEGIGEDLVGALRFTLFGTPVSGNAAARVGVAVDVQYAIDYDDASDDPRWTVTPLVFIGATFADLMAH
jgi:hypothetical protein